VLRFFAPIDSLFSGVLFPLRAREACDRFRAAGPLLRKAVIARSIERTNSACPIKTVEEEEERRRGSAPFGFPGIE
jgi:hypothetical protein